MGLLLGWGGLECDVCKYSFTEIDMISLNLC